MYLFEIKWSILLSNPLEKYISSKLYSIFTTAKENNEQAHRNYSKTSGNGAGKVPTCMYRVPEI